MYHVLDSRTGIPISLSVIFAAICRRVDVQLDFIGLPGHFLLATRPAAAGGARVFVDAFHGGELLDLDACKQIVGSYGIAWADEMANPVPPAEVWGRMVRNLANCHSQIGEFAQARLAQQLLVPLMPGDHAALRLDVPYPADPAEEADQPVAGQGVHAGVQSPQELMQMLQSLLQMNGPPSS